MTLVPNSSISANGGDINTLEVTVANETVLIRPGYYLVADGNDSDAIEVSSNANTILVAGSLAADEGNAINLIGSNNEVAISASGNLVSGNDAIYGLGTTNMVTNDGTIIGGGSGIDLRKQRSGLAPGGDQQRLDLGDQRGCDALRGRHPQQHRLGGLGQRRRRLLRQLRRQHRQFRAGERGPDQRRRGCRGGQRGRARC